MLKLLGIDYGDARVGLALAQSPLAEPLTIAPADQAISTIIKLIDTQSIDIIVIGISEGETAQKTLEFARKIKRLTSTPIYFQDETLSSQETAIKLEHSSKTKREGPIDHFVATSILQDFIDTNLPLEQLPETGKME